MGWYSQSNISCKPQTSSTYHVRSADPRTQQLQGRSFWSNIRRGLGGRISACHPSTENTCRRWRVTCVSHHTTPFTSMAPNSPCHRLDRIRRGYRWNLPSTNLRKRVIFNYYLVFCLDLVFN